MPDDTPLELDVPIVLDPLEEIEGNLPVGTRLKINGLAPQLSSPLHKGERYVTLVYGGITNLAFPEDAKRGTMRVHTQQMAEAYVVPEPLALQLLAAVRAAHQAEMLRLFPPSEGPLDEALRDATADELADLEKQMEREEAAIVADAEAAGTVPGADEGAPEHLKKARDVGEPKSPREIERDRLEAERQAGDRDALPDDDAFLDPELEDDELDPLAEPL